MNNPTTPQPENTSHENGAKTLPHPSLSFSHPAEYEHVKAVGQGTFGEVWMTKERVTGVYRAIKFFSRSSQTTEIDGLCEFQRRALYHEHLVQVYLVGQTDGYYYVVMELADDIKGKVALDPQYYEPANLERILKDRGALNPQEGVRYWCDLLEGIDYLHRQGLVHRDVKPSNVLFVNQQIKICDYGLIAPGSRAIERAGTPGYWRPDGPTDRESDIYAVTKIAYQMLTGRDVSAFADLPSDLARSAGMDNFKIIQDTLERGCSTNPRRRFSSAQAMLNQIKRMPLSGVEASSTTISSGSKGRLFDKASRLVLWMALVSLVATTGWLALKKPITSFSPLLNMRVTLFPDNAGNPNALRKTRPELVEQLQQTISTRYPTVPNRPARYAKVHIHSDPSSYMLVFWISPSGSAYMTNSEGQVQNFYIPKARDQTDLSSWDFRHLDGELGNYTICSFQHDRPFKDPEGLRREVESLAKQAHPPLPRGVIRILRGNNVETIPPLENELDYGLLGAIRSRFLGISAYSIVGIELHLPFKGSAQLPGIESDDPLNQE